MIVLILTLTLKIWFSILRCLLSSKDRKVKEGWPLLSWNPQFAEEHQHINNFSETRNVRYYYYMNNISDLFKQSILEVCENTEEKQGLQVEEAIG